MNLAPVQAIESDVLYQGFILYPYRPTPSRRQPRWTFGPLYPRAYARPRGAELSSQQTQCLVEGGRDALVEIRACFLQLIDRQPGRLEAPLAALPGSGEPRFAPVDRLELDGDAHYRWHEALEREVEMPAATLGELDGEGAQLRFEFEAARSVEGLRERGGQYGGVLVRTRERLSGELTAYSQQLDDDLFRLTVRLENLTPSSPRMSRDPDAAALHSLASAHTALCVDGARLVSLIDPPRRHERAAVSCVNRGCFPVLVGDPERCDTLLSSPVILYDFPQTAHAA